MTKVLAIVASLALVLAACAAPNDTGSPDVSVPGNLESPVELAVADLQSLLGDDAEISVVLVEDVMWPDGSLGCPQPGMAYTQALVDGYRIKLTDGSDTYAYHGAVGRDPFLCDNPDDPGSVGGDAAPPMSTAPGTDTNEGGSVKGMTADSYDGPTADLVVVAVADLAERKGVPVDDIVVVSAESVVWPDGSLGCPQPDMAYPQVQIDGAKIVLSIDGGIYTYHSGGTRPPFLCVPQKPAPGTTGLTLPGTDNE